MSVIGAYYLSILLIVCLHQLSSNQHSRLLQAVVFLHSAIIYDLPLHVAEFANWYSIIWPDQLILGSQIKCQEIALIRKETASDIHQICSKRGHGHPQAQSATSGTVSPEAGQENVAGACRRCLLIILWDLGNRPRAFSAEDRVVICRWFESEWLWGHADLSSVRYLPTTFQHV